MPKLELKNLIPFEPNDWQSRKSNKRIVIGHNIGFDRSYIREQYNLKVRFIYSNIKKKIFF